MFHDYDPYDHFLFVAQKTQQNENNLDQLSGKVDEQCLLMEQMAEQLKHLTNAIIGLQQINKILNQRITDLESLESTDD